MAGAKRSSSKRKCAQCSKVFSKPEHLKRHIRGHTKERPYACEIYSNTFSRSDSLLRHQQVHVPGESEADPAAPPAASDPVGEAIEHAEPRTWLLEEDFDIDALEFSLQGQLPNITYPDVPPQGEHTAFNPDSEAILCTEDKVKRQWFSYIAPAVEPRSSQSFPSSPSGSSQGVYANEPYRAGLDERLRPCMQDEALPPLEQLNLFANQYFTNFHPLLPIIHAPSFRPTAENALLFLSICSIGSLFVKSSRAVTQGRRLFERLNKAILASWESCLSQSRPDALSMVQAAVLGQTYAMLSGTPTHLVLADVLHGTISA